MSNKLISEFLHNKSAFRHMVISAAIFAVFTLSATITDLYWVIGDMSIAIHPHHYIVLSGLLGSTIGSIGGFIWLLKGIHTYHTNHDKLVKSKTRAKNKSCKQSQAIMKLNKRIDELEAKIGKE